jgi:hypothetical protein
VTITSSDETNLDNCGLGTIKRTWTATDCSGNASSCVQIITIYDDTPPELTIPRDETVECDNVPAVGQASAIDYCNGQVGVAYLGEERIDGDCINNYTLIRTWTTSDCAGNATTLSQTITVQDTTAPWIKTTINDFIDLGCNIDEGSVPKPEVHLNGSDLEAGDNCQGDVTIEYNRRERTNNGCENRIIYYYKAIDACGNETAREDFASITYYWEEDVFAECQPTFAYNGDTATCFSADPNLNTDQFGWSNYFNVPGEYTLRLYWDPGQCDPWSGQETIGIVNINYTGEQITAEYRLNYGYAMNDIALYIGCEALPVNDYGENTIDYNAYNFNLTDLGYISSYTVGPIQVNSPNGIHVIANAETCYQKCRCTKSELDGGTYTPTGDEANVDCNKDRLNDNDLELSNKVSLFPNPVEDILTIGNPQQLELTSADIFDMTGRKVLSFNLKNMGVTKDLNLNDLPSAAYFITIKGVDGQLTKPIIKE